MKFRLIAAITLFVVLAIMYFMFSSDGSKPQQPQQDNGQGYRIN